MNAPNYLAIRQDWLDATDEPVLDPDLPVIDTHHHLYDRPGLRYLLEEYLKDVGGGHDLRASIFVQARAMLRADGPVEMQPVGETEFVNGVAAMSASGIYGPARICSGIVGFADLTLGVGVRPVLNKLIQAGGGRTADGGRFCGIRQTLCWDADSALLNPAYPTHESMIDDPKFLEGFAELADLGLIFEAWAFYHQLSAVARLARAFPSVKIVLNHCGGIVRIRDHAGRVDTHDRWLSGITELAECPNVVVKLSGLGMRIGGFGFEAYDCAPTSEVLAEAWQPWVAPILDAFGPTRCVYGSNFPVDKGSYSFKAGINAVKRLTSSLHKEDRERIFWRNASEIYDLRLPEVARLGGTT